MPAVSHRWSQRGCASTITAIRPGGSLRQRDPISLIRFLISSATFVLVVCQRCHQDIHAGRATSTFDAFAGLMRSDSGVKSCLGPGLLDRADFGVGRRDMVGG